MTFLSGTVPISSWTIWTSTCKLGLHYSLTVNCPNALVSRSGGGVFRNDTSSVLSSEIDSSYFDTEDNESMASSR